ncbi:MAG TPA: hypothetical protein VHT68_12980 [Pseudolabrys sp.]|jgi:hypothetical protein|nr:hypothetical protein [Pseudolabrys sp.]
MHRRIIAARIDAGENPEARAFKRPKLLDWVRNDRARLVVAGLTVLRAYKVAGRPDQNESGRTSYGEPVKMYAFVSGTFDDTDQRELLHLNALRISETNYRKFLSRWVTWLKSSGLASELSAA